MHDPIAPYVAGLDLDSWMQLWQVSQGGDARDDALRALVNAVPLDATGAWTVLDFGCGPGDLGIALSHRFANARVDAVDRDPLLLSICRRRRPAARCLERDAWSADWLQSGIGAYDLIAASTCLHWFDEPRLAELFAEFATLQRPRSVLAFLEPIATDAAAPPDDPGMMDAWKALWTQAHAALGYEHFHQVTSRVPDGRIPIGDAGLPIARWRALVQAAGYDVVEATERAACNVVLIARRTSAVPPP